MGTLNPRTSTCRDTYLYVNTGWPKGRVGCPSCINECYWRQEMSEVSGGVIVVSVWLAVICWDRTWNKAYLLLQRGTMVTPSANSHFIPIHPFFRSARCWAFRSPVYREGILTKRQAGPMENSFYFFRFSLPLMPTYSISYRAIYHPPRWTQRENENRALGWFPRQAKLSKTGKFMIFINPRCAFPSIGELMDPWSGTWAVRLSALAAEAAYKSYCNHRLGPVCAKKTLFYF